MDDSLNVNVLFERFFARWYPPQWVQVNGSPKIRPDMTNRQNLRGRPLNQLSPLPPDIQTKVRNQIAIALRAAEIDWPNVLGVAKPVDLKWVEAFDRSWPLEELTKLVTRANAEDLSNMYVVVSCEFGAVMGHVLQSIAPRLVWIPQLLYWDSELFDPQSGLSIPVFHWAIKKMSSYGVNDGFAAKVGACLQILDKRRG